MKRVEFNVASEWRCEAEYDDRNILKRFIYLLSMLCGTQFWSNSKKDRNK